MKLKIKEGDKVQVTAGSDKGKKGIVLDINKTKLKIRVKDVRIQTLFDKKEGIQKREGFIDYSNVKLLESVAKDVKAKKAKTKEKKPGLFSK